MKIGTTEYFYGTSDFYRAVTAEALKTVKHYFSDFAYDLADLHKTINRLPEDREKTFVWFLRDTGTWLREITGEPENTMYIKALAEMAAKQKCYVLKINGMGYCSISYISKEISSGDLDRYLDC